MSETPSRLVRSHTVPTGLTTLIPNAPVLSSGSQDWNNILVEQYQHPVGARANEVSPLSNHWLTVFLGQPRKLLQKRDGRTHESVMQAGEHTVIPAGQPSYWQCNGGIDILHVHLEPSFITTLAETSEINSDRIEIVNCFSGRDPHIQHIAQSLFNELKSPGLMGQMYIESLTHLLAIHLIRHHSAFAVKLQQVKEGLSPSTLQQVIEYIHTYLEQELTLVQLASIAAMSPAYFSTQFKASMGLAPHQYVIEQRIEKAKQLLLQGKYSIGEVALQVGFCDQSHLTRHMRRLLGITPKTLLKVHS
jgi:AraC family transcriptional regulator